MKNELSSAIITIKPNKKEKIFIDSYFEFKKVEKDKDFFILLFINYDEIKKKFEKEIYKLMINLL